MVIYAVTLLAVSSSSAVINLFTLEQGTTGRVVDAFVIALYATAIWGLLR